MRQYVKRAVSIAMSSIISLSLFVGCSGNSTPASDDSGSGDSQVTESTVASSDPVTIKIISVQQTEQPDGTAELALAEEYMKQNPNVKIEFIGVPMNNLFSKITALSTAGDMPDAFTMSTRFKAQANEYDICEDLNNIFTAEELAEFNDKSIEEASIDGKLLSFPWFATPMGMIYRSDWFEEKGISVPETWDDFIDTAQRLTEDTDGDGKTDRWGFGMMAMRNGSASSRFVYMLRTFGIEEVYQNEDGTWASDVGSDKYKEFLQMFTDFNNKYKIAPPGVIETGYPEAAQSFASGKVGMMISGPNAIPTIYDQNPDLKGKIACCPLPKDEKHISSLAQIGYAICKDSPNKEAVADYLRFITEDENSIAWNKVSGRVPVKKSLTETAKQVEPVMQDFSNLIPYCYYLPEYPGLSEIEDIMAESYQNTIANGISVEDASNTAAEKVQNVLKKYA